MTKFLLGLLLLLHGSLAHARDDHHHSRTVYVFGDSLSDNGNFVVLYPNTLFPIFQPPTALPRCSNGPMWPDYLGELMNQPITPVVSGGNNYAIAAATISPSNPYTFDAADTGYAMVDRFLAKYGSADPEAIYIVWLGTNDLDWPASFTEQNFSNLLVMIGRLYDAGARRFLIPNIYDQDDVPLFVHVFQLSPTYLGELTQMAVLWSQLLDTLQSKFPLANIRISDVRKLYLSIHHHPLSFGFTDTADACFHDWTTLAVCADPDDYLFWDESHPSTHTHKLIASLFALDLLIAGDITLEDFRADRN
jgi:phospholipase/lecithinase/hemolysin